MATRFRLRNGLLLGSKRGSAAVRCSETSVSWKNIFGCTSLCLVQSRGSPDAAAVWEGERDKTTPDKVMAGGVGSGHRMPGAVKEEQGLSNSQMSTQPHPFRSHTGVFEREWGENLFFQAPPLKSWKRPWPFNVRSLRSREREARDQKKPRPIGTTAPTLPGFGGMQQVRENDEGGVEHFDLTGDDDLMGGEGNGTASRRRPCHPRAAIYVTYLI